MGWFFRAKKTLEPVAKYNVALGAPIVDVTPDVVVDGPSGVYNVVFVSSDGANRREKELWAPNPNAARELAEAHEAEYVELTGAPTYFYDRIDYPKEQQNQ